MQSILHKDGSYLQLGTDEETPGLSLFLESLGVPIAEIEARVRQLAASSGTGACESRDCERGWVAFHAGEASAKENGWSFSLANRPNSAAAKQARASWLQFKTHTYKRSVGE